MKRTTFLSTLSIFLLALAVALPLAAAEPAEAPLEPTAPAEAPAQAEPAPAALELAELLVGDPPLMSVEPKQQAAGADSLPTETGWWQGICWTSCWPCNSDADCPWGERCVFNAQCP